MEPTTWKGWRAHFEHRAERPRPTILADADLPEVFRKPMLRSLAIFQLGESGEGRITREIYHSKLAGIDDDYRVALGLFVAEEGRHARILGDILRALGGQTIAHTWSERLFRTGRRLMGIRLKLMVLLAAEVLGMVFYGYLLRALGGSTLGDALEGIIEDERLHWWFHVEFFQRSVQSRWSRWAFCALWWAVGGAACLTVAWDHRHTLRTLGVTSAQVWADASQWLFRTSRALLGRDSLPAEFAWEAKRHAA